MKVGENMGTVWYEYEYEPSTGSVGIIPAIIVGIICALAIYWIFIDSAISTYREGRERKRKKEEWEKKNHKGLQ